ncbi:MAG: iron ABC transporter permease [Pseudomonadales bacterium]|nr:iron ABC transporter permease [Pseudomonadales bacterium]
MKDQTKTFSNLQLYSALFALLLFAFFLALHIGPSDIDIEKAARDLIEQRQSVDAIILFEVRLPRIFLALFIGATLGLSGAALQGLLRNPLAEPGIIGVSNCAALGAVIVFYFGLSGLAWYALPLGGLLGALLSVILIFLLTGKNSSIVTLILAGIAINAIGSAMIALVLNYAPNPYAMQEIVFWMMGSVSNRSLQDVAISLPFMIVGWILILYCGKFLNALSLGEDTAKSMGFNLQKLRWILVIGVASCVGAAVSVSGNIGFIGLVIPHLIRPFINYEPKRLLGLSAIGGAILLMFSDMAIQAFSSGDELKLGVVTALVGGPFFLYLILKTRSAML